MTWAMQVAHVAWKDMRESRWVLLAFIALSIVSSAHSLGDGTPRVMVVDGGGGPDLNVAVWLLAFFTPIMLTQSDPPSSARTFWSTRPLSGLAVLAGKVSVLLLVLVLVPTVEDCIVLGALGFGAHEMTLEIVEGLMWWLRVGVTVLLAAALTHDIKTFVLTLVAVMVCYLGANVFWPRNTSFALFAAGVDTTLLVWVWSAMAVSCTMLLYATKEINVRLWLPVFVVMVSLVESFDSMGGSGSTAAAANSTSTISDRLSLQSVAVVGGSGDSARLNFQLVAALDSASSRITISNAVVTVADDSGSAFALTSELPSWTVRSPKAPLQREWLWASNSDTATTSIALSHLPAKVAHRVHSGSNITLHANVLTEWETVLRTNAANGDIHPVSGGTFTIMSIQKPPYFHIHVRLRTVREAASLLNPATMVEFLLVNRVRKQSVLLEPRNIKSTWRRPVLPASEIGETTADLYPRGMVLPQGVFDDSEWLRDAELIVSAANRRTAVPVTLTYVIP